MRTGFEATLLSPCFLYRMEDGVDDTPKVWMGMKAGINCVATISAVAPMIANA